MAVAASVSDLRTHENKQEADSGEKWACVSPKVLSGQITGEQVGLSQFLTAGN